MSTDLRPVEDVPPPPPSPATLVHAVGATGCASCGAQMASDQHYCVNCGVRRGRARFTTESPAPAPAAAVASPLPAAPRSTAPTALIAGIGTLLLAMGVGVLIGRGAASDAPATAAKPQIITVGGAAATSTPAADARGTAARSGGKKNAKKGGPKVKTKVVRVTEQVKQQAAAAAAKTLGGSAPKDPTVDVGGSCQAGTAGCNDSGKFDGNFFGP